MDKSVDKNNSSEIRTKNSFSTSRYGRARRPKITDDYYCTDEALSPLLTPKNKKENNNLMENKRSYIEGTNRLLTPDIESHTIIDNDADYNSLLKIVSRPTGNVPNSSPNSPFKSSLLKTYRNRKKRFSESSSLSLDQDTISQLDSFSWTENCAIDTICSTPTGINTCTKLNSNNLDSSSVVKNILQEFNAIDDECFINNVSSSDKTSETQTNVNNDLNVKTEVQSPIIDSTQSISEVSTTVVDKENNWNVGDLVWTRVGNHPLWPSMIDLDPFSNTFSKTKFLGRKEFVFLHVRFFGDSGRRSWVPENTAIKFINKEQFDQLENEVKKSNKLSKKDKYLSGFIINRGSLSKWLKATEEAESLINASLEDRLKFFEEVIKKKKIKSLAANKSLIENKTVTSSPPVIERNSFPQVLKSKLNKRNYPERSRKQVERYTATDYQSLIISQLEDVENKEQKSPVPAVPDQIPIEQPLVPINPLTRQRKNNLFRGATREKVCQICEKLGNVYKCRGVCMRYYHLQCVKNIEKCSTLTVKTENNVNEVETKHTVSLSVSEQIDAKMEEIMKNVSEKNKYTEDSSSDDTSLSNTTFHVTGDMSPNSFTYENSEFKCLDCTENRLPACLICKSDEDDKSNNNCRQKCSFVQCGRVYHPQCLKSWPQTQWLPGTTTSKQMRNNEVTPEILICPYHVCHMCVSDNPRGLKARFSSDRLAKCVRCPTTYHASNFCIPAGSQILNSSQIICPKHFINQKNKRKSSHHLNASWCFICSMGGSLICCETCPTSFHANCLKISPPEGCYICEDCETGRLPLYDEIVWVKLGTFRWWPAQILFPNEIPTFILSKDHQVGEFVVRFFGSHDYYWINRGRVFLYQEDDGGHACGKRKNVNDLFTKALKEAAEAYKIVQMERENRAAETKPSMKPPPYIRIKNNKPVGSVRMAESNMNSLTPCECDPNALEPCGPDSECLNRLLLTECNSLICPAGDRCCNQQFEKRQYPQLKPYKTQTRGWGLKSLDPLVKGQFIIEYVGEMIDETEYRKRIKRMNEQKDENYYFLTIDKDRILDAGPKGNVARFMNHSCQPNCETQKWTVNGCTRVGLFALEDINPDTELTFNYNLECIGTEKKICKCGAPQCSGFIGVKAIKQKEVKIKEEKNKGRIKYMSSKIRYKCKSLVCFTCGKVGAEGRCRSKRCSKMYHLACVGLKEWPRKNWWCSRHKCNICLRQKMLKWCTKCPKSYCPFHIKNGYNLDEFICNDHSDNSTVDSKEVTNSDPTKLLSSPVSSLPNSENEKKSNKLDSHSDNLIPISANKTSSDSIALSVSLTSTFESKSGTIEQKSTGKKYEESNDKSDNSTVSSSVKIASDLSTALPSVTNSEEIEKKSIDKKRDKSKNKFNNSIISSESLPFTSELPLPNSDISEKKSKDKKPVKSKNKSNNRKNLDSTTLSEQLRSTSEQPLIKSDKMVKKSINKKRVKSKNKSDVTLKDKNKLNSTILSRSLSFTSKLPKTGSIKKKSIGKKQDKSRNKFDNSTMNLNKKTSLNLVSTSLSNSDNLTTSLDENHSDSLTHVPLQKSDTIDQNNSPNSVVVKNNSDSFVTSLSNFDVIEKKSVCKQIDKLNTTEDTLMLNSNESIPLPSTSTLSLLNSDLPKVSNNDYSNTCIKRGRGRPRKHPIKIRVPGRGRGRPRLYLITPKIPGRGRGRPRKFVIKPNKILGRGRGRPKKDTLKSSEEQNTKLFVENNKENNIILTKCNSDEENNISKQCSTTTSDRIIVKRCRGRPKKIKQSQVVNCNYDDNKVIESTNNFVIDDLNEINKSTTLADTCSNQILVTNESIQQFKTNKTVHTQKCNNKSVQLKNGIKKRRYSIVINSNNVKPKIKKSKADVKIKMGNIVGKAKLKNKKIKGHSNKTTLLEDNSLLSDKNQQTTEKVQINSSLVKINPDSDRSKSFDNLDPIQTDKIQANENLLEGIIDTELNNEVCNSMNKIIDKSSITLGNNEECSGTVVKKSEFIELIRNDSLINKVDVSEENIEKNNKENSDLSKTISFDQDIKLNSTCKTVENQNECESKQILKDEIDKKLHEPNINKSNKNVSIVSDNNICEEKEEYESTNEIENEIKSCKELEENEIKSSTKLELDIADNHLKVNGMIKSENMNLIMTPKNVSQCKTESKENNKQLNKKINCTDFKKIVKATNIKLKNESKIKSKLRNSNKTSTCNIKNKSKNNVAKSKLSNIQLKIKKNHCGQKQFLKENELGISFEKCKIQEKVDEFCNQSDQLKANNKDVQLENKTENITDIISNKEIIKQSEGLIINCTTNQPSEKSVTFAENSSKKVKNRSGDSTKNGEKIVQPKKKFKKNPKNIQTVNNSSEIQENLDLKNLPSFDKNVNEHKNEILVDEHDESKINSIDNSSELLNKLDNVLVNHFDSNLENCEINTTKIELNSSIKLNDLNNSKDKLPEQMNEIFSEEITEIKNKDLLEKNELSSSNKTVEKLSERDNSKIDVIRKRTRATMRLSKSASIEVGELLLHSDKTELNSNITNLNSETHSLNNDVLVQNSDDLVNTNVIHNSTINKKRSAKLKQNDVNTDIVHTLVNNKDATHNHLDKNVKRKGKKRALMEDKNDLQTMKRLKVENITSGDDLKLSSSKKVSRKRLKQPIVSNTVNSNNIKVDNIKTSIIS